MSTVPPRPAAVLGLLGDERRLKVVAALALGARTVAAIVDATGLDERTVDRAIEQLAPVGLVDTVGPSPLGPGGLRLVPSVIARAAQAAAHMRPEVTPEDLGASDEAASVLRSFLDDGRLTSIPAAKGKRLVVLDFLANRFEPGRVYPERDVNFTLGRFHADFAALRRYLVDEGFLERRDGFYWRAGGSFDV